MFLITLCIYDPLCFVNMNGREHSQTTSVFKMLKVELFESIQHNPTNAIVCDISSDARQVLPC